MKKSVVFMTPYFTGARGNVTTAKRIQAGYERANVAVEVFAYAEGATFGDLEPILARTSCSYLHILHITRFVKWMEEEKIEEPPLPYMVTMGGTDVHVDLANRRIKAQEHQFLEQANRITCFSSSARQTLLNVEPRWANKCNVIPQGIVLPKTDKATRIHFSHGHHQKLYILLPAGLRRVKDVLHVLAAWDQLNKTVADFKVTIIGEQIEKEAALQLQHAMKTRPYLHYTEPVPFEQMGEVYAKADLVINTSLQEGQPTSICEAMGLGIPVIARENPGNQAVIQHEHTGYLYSTPADFYQYTIRLLEDKKQTRSMVKYAKEFIEKELTVEKEIQAYLSCMANEIKS